MKSVLTVAQLRDKLAALPQDACVCVVVPGVGYADTQVVDVESDWHPGEELPGMVVIKTFLTE